MVINCFFLHMTINDNLMTTIIDTLMTTIYKRQTTD
jgi:hypothetical protein